MKNGDVCRLVGQNIRKLRQERGWTQQRLAEMVEANIGYISAIERGRCVGEDMLDRFCESFGVTLDELTRSTSKQNGPAASVERFPEVTRMILQELEGMPEYTQLRLLATIVETRMKGEG